MKIALYVLGVIVSTFLLLIGAVLFVGGTIDKIVSMAIVGFIILVLSICSIVYLGKKIPKKEKAKKIKQDTSETEKPRLTYKEKVLQNREKTYRNMKYKFTFVSGLPLMQGTVCKVVSTPDRLVIEGQGTTFELRKEKITSITIEKNITKHTQAVSSAGGALAGAMAFGVVGAAIGGRATTKNVKSLKYYIVVTYFDSDDNVKYIIFDNNIKGSSLVEDFRLFNKSDVVKRIVEID